jgi:hypothetical protein
VETIVKSAVDAAMARVGAEVAKNSARIGSAEAALQATERRSLANAVRIDSEIQESRRLWQPELIENVHNRLMETEQRAAVLLQKVGSSLLPNAAQPIVNSRYLLPGLIGLFALSATQKDRIYGGIGSAAAEISSKAIADEKLIDTVLAVITAVTQAPATLNSLALLLEKLLDQASTLDALTRLVLRLLAKEETKDKLRELVHELFEHPEIQAVRHSLTHSLTHSLGGRIDTAYSSYLPSAGKRSPVCSVPGPPMSRCLHISSAAAAAAAVVACGAARTVRVAADSIISSCGRVSLAAAMVGGWQVCSPGLIGGSERSDVA